MSARENAHPLRRLADEIAQVATVAAMDDRRGRLDPLGLVLVRQATRTLQAAARGELAPTVALREARVLGWRAHRREPTRWWAVVCLLSQGTGELFSDREVGRA